MLSLCSAHFTWHNYQQRRTTEVKFTSDPDLTRITRTMGPTRPLNRKPGRGGSTLGGRVHPYNSTDTRQTGRSQVPFTFQLNRAAREAEDSRLWAEFEAQYLPVEHRTTQDMRTQIAYANSATAPPRQGSGNGIPSDRLFRTLEDQRAWSEFASRSSANGTQIAPAGVKNEKNDDLVSLQQQPISPPYDPVDPSWRSRFLHDVLYNNATSLKHGPSSSVRSATAPSYNADSLRHSATSSQETPSSAASPQDVPNGASSVGLGTTSPRYNSPNSPRWNPTTPTKGDIGSPRKDPAPSSMGAPPPPAPPLPRPLLPKSQAPPLKRPSELKRDLDAFRADTSPTSQNGAAVAVQAQQQELYGRPRTPNAPSGRPLTPAAPPRPQPPQPSGPPAPLINRPMLPPQIKLTSATPPQDSAAAQNPGLSVGSAYQELYRRCTQANRVLNHRNEELEALRTLWEKAFQLKLGDSADVNVLIEAVQQLVQDKDQAAADRDRFRMLYEQLIQATGI
ncbi:hypothetical protein F5Y18DRAFT_401512 [Xylariaceae sp. FL1019]|nr:hypothetical protein F5Y18DRAFT_401512 [Xylariaceae sp. FL1019]